MEKRGKVKHANWDTTPSIGKERDWLPEKTNRVWTPQRKKDNRHHQKFVVLGSQTKNPGFVDIRAPG